MNGPPLPHKSGRCNNSCKIATKPTNKPYLLLLLLPPDLEIQCSAKQRQTRKMTAENRQGHLSRLSCAAAASAWMKLTCPDRRPLGMFSPPRSLFSLLLTPVRSCGQTKHPSLVISSHAALHQQVPPCPPSIRIPHTSTCSLERIHTLIVHHRQ